MEDAGEHIAAQAVGTQPVVAARPFVDSEEILLGVVIRRQPGPEDGNEDEQEGDEDPKYGQPVAHQLLQGILPQAALLRHGKQFVLGVGLGGHSDNLKKQLDSGIFAKQAGARRRKPVDAINRGISGPIAIPMNSPPCLVFNCR